MSRRLVVCWIIPACLAFACSTPVEAALSDGSGVDRGAPPRVDVGGRDRGLPAEAPPPPAPGDGAPLAKDSHPPPGLGNL
jgi:hypothetical protein